jgi:tRNA dimethylallyltransferase
MRSDNKSSTKPESSSLELPQWRARYVIITGPTASGKSALALALAKRADGVIINADSMQLYADLQVLTARPDDGALRYAPHRLYGVIDGAERASVGSWLAMAAEAMSAARAAGKLPIIIGGTGMYINAGLNGLATIPDVPADIHAYCSAQLAEMGGDAFRAELAKFDSVAADRLSSRDSQRLIMAMGVIRATGRPLSVWQADPHSGQFDGTALSVALVPPRATLYDRINQRFDKMLAAGAIDEVFRLASRGLDTGLPVMKALGVRELLAHLAGEMSLDRATELAKRDSRHYAKRQMTWLRNNFNPKILIKEEFSESLGEKIFSNLIKNS